MIGPIVMAVFGVIAVAIVVAYLRLRARAAAEYAAAVPLFYEAINPLLLDDEVPVEILDRLAFFNETIDSPAVSVQFLKARTEPPWKAQHSETYKRFNKHKQEFFARRPELESPYQLGMLTWFTAVTARSPLIG
ncbi:MAG: hypothetical protein ACRCTI_02445, partial [Beijerinckiaceae bacterium]